MAARERVRLIERLGALSPAADLASGVPIETSLRTAALAARRGHALGLPAALTCAQTRTEIVETLALLGFQQAAIRACELREANRARGGPGCGVEPERTYPRWENRSGVDFSATNAETGRELEHDIAQEAVPRGST